MNLNDYARSPVPQDKTVSGWHIGLIYIGVGLTLPTFLLGATIGYNLGLLKGLFATFIAGVILTSVAIFTGWIGGQLRLSTYFIIRKTFGYHGATLLNLLLTATIFGWFGVTIDIFSQALHHILPLPFASEIFWSIIGGSLMTLTAILGFKGLDKLSLIAVPVMIITLFWMVLKAVNISSLESILQIQGAFEIPFGVIISMLVGGWMVGVSILPDLSRYAKTPWDGSLGGFLCFLPGLFIIMILTIIPSLVFQQKDFIQLMLMILSPFTAATIIILASWSSNDNNLYASSLGLSSIIHKTPKWMITIVAGIIGTLLGLIGIMNHFVGFLVFLGIFIPPIAGTYIADYLANPTKYQDESSKKFELLSLIGWGMGSLIALSSTPVDNGGFGLWQITSISALDGCLFAFIFTFIFTKFKSVLR